jgi:hypothetical protein
MTPPLIRPPLVRGPIFGPCNICLIPSKLTEDHVPPKGVLKVPQVDLFHIQDLLSSERPIGKRRAKHMQSGVLYRSICTECNSKRLGATYDPHLISLANSLTEILKARIQLPRIINVATFPGMVTRAVLGHLLAVGIERTERTPLLDEVREFVIDQSKPMPAGIRVHYWIYPYTRQIALRDAAIMLDFFKTNIVIWSLKFFPVGFLVTWDTEDRSAIPEYCFNDFMIGSGMHPADVQFRLSNIPNQFWPEAPTDSSAIFLGDGGHGAIPHAA